jgi:hypothetical protein
MKTKPATISKYIEVAKALRSLLMVKNRIDSTIFCLRYKVTGGFVGEMARAGFIKKIGVGTYEWTHDLAVTTETIREMLEVREQNKLARSIKAAKKVEATNDCGTMEQEGIDFLVANANPTFMSSSFDITLPNTSINEVDPKDVSRSEHVELQQRVAALEQLIIRRGVA